MKGFEPAKRPRSSRSADPNRSPGSAQAETTGKRGATVGVPTFVKKGGGLKATIHTDAAAANAAESLGAEAFTVGRDVYFAAGRYAPETEAGRRLLAHELTHVAQQQDAVTSAGKGSSAAWEREAERAAASMRSADSPRAAIPEQVTSSPLRIACSPDAKPGATSRDDLEKRYGVKIERGDRDWTDDEIQELGRALGRLAGRELTAIKGYSFKRWKTVASRAAADPGYDSSIARGQECGLHEADLAKGKLLISMYDDCFDPDSTMAGVPLGQFNVLHEIGHAMEAASQRAEHRRVELAQAAYDTAYDKAKRALDEYNAASDERNELVEQYNAADGATQRKLKPGLDKAATKVDKLRTKQKTLAGTVDALEKKRDAAVEKREEATERPGKAFAGLVKGKDPLTEYSKEGRAEAFAEAFAIYKIDPKGLKKTNPQLFDWFQKQEELEGVEKPRK